MSKERVLVFTDRLRGMQDYAAEAMANYTPGGVRVPDSIYIGREGCELKESQSSGKLMVSRSFTISDGEYAGLNAWDNLVFEGNEVGVQILRRWVEMHGYEWPEGDLASIEVICNEINEAAPMVRFKVKSSPDKNNPDRIFTNVTVLEMLAGEAAPAASAPAVRRQAAPAVAPVAPAEEAPAKETPAGNDDLDSMSRAELKKYIVENADLAAAVRVTIRMTDDEIRAAVRAQIGEAAPAEEAPAKETPAEDNTDLIQFAASQGVDGVTEDMSLDDIVAVLQGYAYKQAELTADEIDMLSVLGLKANITGTPAPAKPAAAKPATDPAAKPAAAKPTAAPAKPALPAKPAPAPAKPTPKLAAPAKPTPKLAAPAKPAAAKPMPPRRK